jgi:DNA-binding transcriptional LysR family regulator
MLPNPHDLKYFLEVSNSLNISRAAERLGITQPSLSLSIKRLEEDIGTALLIRTKTGVRLTKSGTVLVKNIQSLLIDWENLKKETGRMDQDISGRFTIGTHATVALYSLPVVLNKLLKDFPDLEIKLHHDLSRKVTEEVINFKIDYGIVMNPIQHPDLIIKEICKDEVSLYISSSGSQHLDTLIYDENLLQSQDILKKLNKLKNSFKKTLTSTNLEVVAALTSAGAGIGILPSRIRTNLFKDLEKFEGTWPSFSDTLSLIYRADTQKSVAHKKLSAELFERLKEQLD